MNAFLQRKNACEYQWLEDDPLFWGPFAYFERRWLLVSGSVYQENYSNHHDPSIGVSFQPQISGNVSGTVKL